MDPAAGREDGERLFNSVSTRTRSNFFDAMRLVQSMADSPSVFAFAGVRCGVRILIPEFANEYLQTIVYGHLHELFLIVLPDRSTQLFQRH
jgi:hypothetical protein